MTGPAAVGPEKAGVSNSDRSPDSDWRTNHSGRIL